MGSRASHSKACVAGLKTHNEGCAPSKRTSVFRGKAYTRRGGPLLWLTPHSPLIHASVLQKKRTRMGHAEFAVDGADFDDETSCERRLLY